MSGGTNYVTGDTIVITGNEFEQATPANDVTLTFTDSNADGIITAEELAVTGTVADNNKYYGPLSWTGGQMPLVYVCAPERCSFVETGAKITSVSIKFLYFPFLKKIDDLIANCFF